MAPPPGPLDSLPVLATVAAAYRAFFTGLAGFARAAFLPFGLSVASTVAFAYLSDAPLAGFLFWLVAVSVPCTLFGVAWYRLLLLGSGAARPAPVPAWRTRHWRFLGWMLLLLLLLAAQVAVLFTLSLMATGLPKAAVLLVELVLLLVVLVVALRLSLVFPAAAVDVRYGLTQAWRHTRRQGLRLLAAAVLGLFPFVLVGGLLLPALYPSRPAEVEAGMIVIGPGEGQLPVVDLGLLTRAVGDSAVSYLALALAMAIVAAAFRTFTGWTPGAGGSGPQGAVDPVDRGGA
ncbi:MAG: hypothetical protein QNJ67_06665 [Kiloniellales bacterium]|nr:hypothetical protein [Kiloniellales bacterium]